MRKFFALFQNEWVKLTHRMSTLICLLITIGLMLLMASIIVFMPNNWQNGGTNPKSRIEANIDEATTFVKDFSDKLKASEVGSAEWKDHARMVATNKAFLTRSKLSLSLLGGSRQSEPAWIMGASQLYEKYVTTVELSLIYSENKVDLLDEKTEKPVDLESVKALVTKLERCITSENLADFIEVHQACLTFDGATEEAKKDARITDMLWQKALPQGKVTDIELNGKISDTINLLSEYKDRLRTNQHAGNSLTLKEKTATENAVKVIEAQFENNYFTKNLAQKGNVAEATSSIFSGVLYILMIILGGSMVSQEIQSGAIKILLIVPAKRKKVFWAKVLSLIAFGFVASIVGWLLIMATSFIFAGGLIPTYVGIVFGKLVVLPSALILLVSIMLNALAAIVFACFAMMLSIAFKSTALAVSLSVASILGGSLFENLMMMLFGLRGAFGFLPFNNMPWNYMDKIFNHHTMIFANQIMVDNQMGMVRLDISLCFSICYTLIFMALLLFISRESFCKKDILK